MITVRRALARDVAAIVDFMAAMAAETEDRPLDRARVRAGVEHAIRHPADAIYLVAEHDGVVRGCLMLTFEWSDWRAGRFWWIQSVFVDPGHRRQGIYSHLHDAARTMAAADPLACGIRLYVEAENVAAQAAYRRLGMVETHYRLFEETFAPPGDTVPQPPRTA